MTYHHLKIPKETVLLMWQLFFKSSKTRFQFQHMHCQSLSESWKKFVGSVICHRTVGPEVKPRTAATSLIDFDTFSLLITWNFFMWRNLLEENFCHKCTNKIENSDTLFWKIMFSKVDSAALSLIHSWRKSICN